MNTTGALPEARRMLSQEQVLAIVPISYVTLWRMEKRGQFPQSTFITPNRRVWFEDEIVAWQNEVNGRRRGRHPARTKSQTAATQAEDVTPNS